VDNLALTSANWIGSGQTDVVYFSVNHEREAAIFIADVLTATPTGKPHRQIA
jgi:hypothetical protein